MLLTGDQAETARDGGRAEADVYVQPVHAPRGLEGPGNCHRRDWVGSPWTFQLSMLISACCRSLAKSTMEMLFRDVNLTDAVAEAPRLI